MQLKGYAKLVDLSKDKFGPEKVAYITVKKRAKDDKYVRIRFTTWIKHTKENVIYLDSVTSEKLKKAFSIIHSIEKGKAKLVKI